MEAYFIKAFIFESSYFIILKFYLLLLGVGGETIEGLCVQIFKNLYKTEFTYLLR